MEKSFLDESVVFTFPYQTNGNHVMEQSKVGNVILRTTLKRYFRFHSNCKQLRVEARNSTPNCEIYFPIFSETVYLLWLFCSCISRSFLVASMYVLEVRWFFSGVHCQLVLGLKSWLSVIRLCILLSLKKAFSSINL